MSCLFVMSFHVMSSLVNYCLILIGNNDIGNNIKLAPNDIAHHVALTVGYLVGSMGGVQTVGALVVFPIGVQRLGPLYTAAAGALLMAISGVTLTIVTRYYTTRP